jgi:hypothetical protein
MYDKFVHGSYVTATELYDPRSWKFMLRGHEAPAKRQEYLMATGSKLHHAVTALAAIAELERNHGLVDEICRAGLALHASGDRRILLTIEFCFSYVSNTFILP